MNDQAAHDWEPTYIQYRTKTGTPARRIYAYRCRRCGWSRTPQDRPDGYPCRPAKEAS